MKNIMKGLQFIINTDPKPPHHYVDLAKAALDGGVDSIQFRHKGVYDREIYILVVQLAEMCRQSSVPLIINDRIDIAMAVNAEGVHLGQTDLTLQSARKLLGNDKIIGATASTLEQAQQAEKEGADYIGFGHIYPTRTKIKHDPPVGLIGLKQVHSQIRVPIFAIGGINEHNLADVCATVDCGIAVITAISTSPDPLNQIKHFKNIMRNYASSPNRIIS